MKKTVAFFCRWVLAYILLERLLLTYNSVLAGGNISEAISLALLAIPRT